MSHIKDSRLGSIVIVSALIVLIAGISRWVWSEADAQDEATAQAAAADKATAGSEASPALDSDARTPRVEGDDDSDDSARNGRSRSAPRKPRPSGAPFKDLRMKQGDETAEDRIEEALS